MSETAACFGSIGKALGPQELRRRKEEVRLCWPGGRLRAQGMPMYSSHLCRLRCNNFREPQANPSERVSALHTHLPVYWGLEGQSLGGSAKEG